MTPVHHTGRFHFNSQDAIYTNHFPGCAVIPGTLIIAAFLKVVEQMGIQAAGLERFRFKTFLPPGVYCYELIVATDAIRCILMQKDREVVRGKITYAA